MESKQTKPLRFRGSPRIVQGVAPLTSDQALNAALSLDLKLPQAHRVTRETPEHPLQTVPLSSFASRLRFSLPESTPPGAYEGSVQIGNETYPVVVEVEPHPQLFISPRQLIIQAVPGQEITMNLSLGNSGNMPCDIRKGYAFGLFEVNGLDRAIGAALGQAPEEGRTRLDRLIDEAADNHGGSVRVNVQEGAGVLEPGDLRDLTVTLRFTDRLKPEHTYWGTWPLYNLRYYVKVFVGPKEDKDSGHETQEEAR